MTSHEQQVGCAFHKTRIGGVDLLKPRQLQHQPFVTEDRHWVPSTVRHEAAVKDVKTTQALDAKVRVKKILQFAGGKKVKVHRNTASVAELDFAPVQTMVEFEVSGPLDRIDEHGGRAADRAHGGDEMAPGHSSELGCDFREVRDRQVAENAVETKSNVEEGVRLGQPVQKIGNLKREVHARKSGEITRQSPGSYNLR